MALCRDPVVVAPGGHLRQDEEAGCLAGQRTPSGKGRATCGMRPSASATDWPALHDRRTDVCELAHGETASLSTARGPREPKRKGSGFTGIRAGQGPCRSGQGQRRSPAHLGDRQQGWRGTGPVMSAWSCALPCVLSKICRRRRSEGTTATTASQRPARTGVCMLCYTHLDGMPCACTRETGGGGGSGGRRCAASAQRPAASSAIVSRLRLEARVTAGPSARTGRSWDPGYARGFASQAPSAASC